MEKDKMVTLIGEDIMTKIKYWLEVDPMLAYSFLGLMFCIVGLILLVLGLIYALLED